MSKSKKWFDCNQCEKRLSSYKSLWRHKKICNYNMDNRSTLNLPICTQKQAHLAVNHKDTELNNHIDRIINDSPSSDVEHIGDSGNNTEIVLSLPFSNDLTTSEKSVDSGIENEQYRTVGEITSQQETNENENKNNGDENLNDREENKDSVNNKKVIIVYGLEIPNKALTNFELYKYCNQLNISSLRGIFARDSLPMRPQENECGIVNFNTSSEPGSHWVCYYKTGTDRIYFDSYGQITPYEVQNYLKTKHEIKLDQQVIKRNTDIVQPDGTEICGHLCLYVLKSLSDGMSFWEVLKNLSNPQEGKGIKWTDELANELHKPLRHNFQKDMFLHKCR